MSRAELTTTPSLVGPDWHRVIGIPTEFCDISMLQHADVLTKIPEESYNRIVRCVSEYFKVPICLISLIDNDRQWFKAKVGIEDESVAREASFCQAALDQNDVYIVEDASLSPKFMSHPMVTCHGGIRFYAGVPLFVEGRSKLGTLCILDSKPRRLDVAQIQALRDFAALVVDELHLRLRAVTLEKRLASHDRMAGQTLAVEKERADFLAMVTHEIRAPLNAILGMVTLLSLEGAEAEKSFSVGDVRASTEYLVRLINEVLDLAKLEATGFPFLLAPFNLRLELACMVDIVRAQADAKHLALSLTLSDDVPELIVGDRTRLSQVLLNLLNNAVKFTKRGRVDLVVDAKATGQCVEITFSVTDTGIGLSNADQAKIFQGFTQISPDAGSVQPGTGLGLVISKKLVEAMGGKIAISSASGQGSQFSFSLQFKIASVAVPAFKPAEMTLLRGLKVLIVDDDMVGTRVCKALLKHLGCIGETVSSGHEALDKLSSETFDVVLTDINLPDIDGYAIVEQYRASTHYSERTVFIALTGTTASGKDPRASFFAHYLMKPVTLAVLTESLSDVTLRLFSSASTDGDE